MLDVKRLGAVCGLALLSAAPAVAQCELDKLLAAEGVLQERFGSSIALSGERILVGSPREWTFLFESHGAAYVFDRTAQGWIQTAKLSAADAADDDELGAAVALESDRAVLGAPGDAFGPGFGKAYVFDRTPSGWVESAKLDPGPLPVGSRFGGAVALSGDRALVGAAWDTHAGQYSGSAHVFVFDGTTWKLEATLIPPDAKPYQGFGHSVAIDGTTALVGAPQDSQLGMDAGAAYVFDRTASGWEFAQKLTGAGTKPADYFAEALALDGVRAAIGAPDDHHSGKSNAGSVYVFDRTPTGWVQDVRLEAPVPMDFAAFGKCVALSGKTVAAGSYGVSQAGAVHVFELKAAGWKQTAKFKPVGLNPNDQFGSSVDVDGDLVAAGSELDDDLGTFAGAAYALSVRGLDCPSLGSDVAGLELNVGGSQQLLLNAGPAHAGRTYVMLGSISGTSPGIPVGSVVIPLVPDVYTAITASTPTSTYTSSFVGVLDYQGRASARFDLPVTPDPSLLWLVVNHAYVLVDGGIDFASNAESLLLGF